MEVCSHCSMSCIDSRTDGIQFNVSHRGEYRLLAEQHTRVKSLLEEMTANLPFAIRLACNRLFEMLHESGHRTQAFAYALDFFGCGTQCFDARVSKLCIFEYSEWCHCCNPTLRHLVSGPFTTSQWVVAQN